jgi:PAS domain S-box-containing protein
MSQASSSQTAADLGTLSQDGMAIAAADALVLPLLLSQLPQLLDLIPQIIWVSDDRGQIVRINSLWQHYTGLAIDDILGRNFWCFFHLDDRPALEAAWQNGVAQREEGSLPWEERARLLMADGAEEWFAVTAQPLTEAITGGEAHGDRMFWFGTISRLASATSDPPLLAGQEFLEALFENVSEGLVACNSAGQIVLFNRAAQAFHGLPPQPIPPDQWSQYYSLYDDDGEQLLELADVPLMRALAGEKVRAAAMMIKPKGGKARSVLTNADPIIDATGRRLGAVALMHDVTEHRQTAAALKLSEQRFQAIFNQTFQLIGLLSPDGILLEANQTALDFAGLTSALVLNRPFWEIHWWQASVATQQQLQQSIQRAAAGEFVRYEVEVLDAQGQLVPIDFSLNPVRGDDGQVVLIIPEGRDISARKQLEAELQASKLELELRVAERTAELAEREAQFRATFDQAAIGCAHVALDGRWLRMNQKICAIVGYTQDELLQKTFQDITYPEDLAADLAYVDQLLAGTIADYSLEKRYIRGDGTIVWVRITVSLRRQNGEMNQLKPPSGEPMYFIVMVEDISDRKQLELQDAVNRQALEKAKQLLEKRNRDLDQFVYVASHDLKAPLRGIANLSEWLEEDLTGQLAPANHEYLVLMRARVKRMENLINGLLEYSRVGREAMETSWVDLRELLLEIVDSLDPPATFVIQLPEIMPKFQTQRLLLSQVFANLLSNAIKHHDRETGKIVVDWAEQDQSYLFSVTDDGPGIPPEQQERVFGIFQTLTGGESTSNTGIGLALVKKIVEDGEGCIRLQSGFNRGCRFEFTWPKS